MNRSGALALLMALLGSFAAWAGFHLLAVSLLLAGFLGFLTFFVWRLLPINMGNARMGDARMGDARMGDARMGNARRGNAVRFDLDGGLNRPVSTLPPPRSIHEVTEDDGGLNHVVPAEVSRVFLNIIMQRVRDFFGYIEQFLMTPQATMEPQGHVDIVDIDIVQADLYHQRLLRIEAERYGAEMPPVPFTDSDDGDAYSDNEDET